MSNVLSIFNAKFTIEVIKNCQCLYFYIYVMYYVIMYIWEVLIHYDLKDQ